MVRSFVSKIWKDFLHENNVKSIHCSIRHPQANCSERIMRILGTFFRVYCSHQHSAWAKHIPQINHLLNFTTHTTTGYTPYELHYGVPPKDKIREMIRFPDEIDEPHEIKIELANNRTRKLHARQREAQNKYSTVPINVGDLVLLRVHKPSSLNDKKISKFFHLYYGPYRVHRAFNENAYELREKDHPERLVGNYKRADLCVYRE